MRPFAFGRIGVFGFIALLYGLFVDAPGVDSVECVIDIQNPYQNSTADRYIVGGLLNGPCEIDLCGSPYAHREFDGIRAVFVARVQTKQVITSFRRREDIILLVAHLLPIECPAESGFKRRGHLRVERQLRAEQ